MKKILKFIFVLICMFETLKAQNTYDIYDTDCGQYSALIPFDPNLADGIDPILSGGFGSYQGEYQVFFNHHPWRTSPSLNTNAMSYRIEAVSFPFTPNCINCQTFFIGTDALDPAKRVLKMPDNQFTYTASQKGWVRTISGLPPVVGATNTNDYLLSREFSGEYGIGIPYEISGDIHFSTLASKGIVGNEFPNYEYHANRKFYPHTVLKHTFYMHCGNSIADKIVDSIVFVIDNTRGRMRYYPFIGSNTSSEAVEHDVTITPEWQWVLLPSDWTTPLDPIEYYPIPFSLPVCQSHFPSGTTNWNNDDYIRPQTRTLLQYFLGNFSGNAAVGYSAPDDFSKMPGIKHDYLIDRSIDLTLLNPSEKVIYNPSEVSIDLNQPFNTTSASKILTFPSGYVFKTVSGLYPTTAQVFAADPDRLYNHPEDIVYGTTLSCDDIATPIDERKSYYYVEDGSTLNIEQCVGIYDAVIIVKSGGTVSYYPNETYGNYVIQKENPTCTTCVINPLIASSSINCAHDCYDLSKYDVKDIIVSSSALWDPPPMTGHPYDFNNDGKLTIAGTITIMPNQTLTINGSYTYEFGENAGIIIQRGAQLIVDGAIFTSADICGKSMWEGIDVWGNRNMPQGGLVGAANQGIINLTNVTIKNARNAIVTQRKGASWDFYGGIVKCDNVIFENNRTAVAFQSYKNIPSPGSAEVKNVSYLKNCEFLITNYLNDPKYKTSDGRRMGNVAQVTMWDVKDVTIQNCIFENTAVKSDGITPLFDTDIRGTGIYAINAGVVLAGGSVANEFKGMSNGAWLIGTGEPDFIFVEGTSFKNNIHGLTIEGMNLPRVNFNTFEIPRHDENGSITDVSLQKGYNKPVGLYFIGSTDITVQENIFKNFGTSSTDMVSPQEYNYGMVVNNCSGSTPSSPGSDGLAYVYKNTFSNLNVGLQAELDNKGGFTSGFPNSGGLEYKCNEFTSRISFDVTVPDGPGISSLMRDQGLCAPLDPQKQAGNTYDPCTILSDEQLSFGTLYSISANLGFEYSDQPFKLQCSSIGDFDCTGVPSSNTCVSNFSLCATIPCLITEYSDALLVAEGLNETYNALLDGGDTPFLLSKINSTMPAGQLKTLLLSKSPYLTDEVLIATLTREDLPPYGHLEQIMIANSPVTQNVMTEIQNVGLPIGILNNIIAAQTGVSLRKEKEAELNYYTFQAKLAEVKLKQEYYKIENLDSLKAVAYKDSTLFGFFKLIEILIGKGDFSEAHDCLEKIKEMEGENHSDKCKLNAISLSLAEENKSWFDMTPKQDSVVRNIYATNPETAIQARAILSLTKGLQYEMYPYDISETRMSYVNDLDNESIQEQKMFKVYPNPGTDFTKVEISLHNKAIQGELIVYNLLGAEILKQAVSDNEILTINTKEFYNGIYLYVLKTANGIVEKQKVIISR